MPRLFQIIVTRTDRATLPAGAAIGFSYTVQAATVADARGSALARIARSDDAALLFIERIEDVTPPVSRY
jgi:hypothetical protein